MTPPIQSPSPSTPPATPTLAFAALPSSLQSALQALDSCFQVAFFGAIDHNAHDPQHCDRDSESDRDRVCDPKQQQRLHSLRAAFLHPHRPIVDPIDCRQKDKHANSNSNSFLNSNDLLEGDSDANVDSNAGIRIGQNRNLSHPIHSHSHSHQNSKHIPSPSRGVTEILHCKQHETWDCGVLCIQMILRWIQNTSGSLSTSTSSTSTNTDVDVDVKIEVDKDTDTDSNHSDCKLGGTQPLTPQEIQQKHQMIQALNTKSIWTIDLVMLFQNILSGRLNLFHEESTHTQTQTHMQNNDPTSPNPNPHSNTNVCTDHTQTWTRSILPPGKFVTYLFCSKNMGVNSTYKGFHYYKKSFRRDEKRVKRLFETAHAQNLPLATITDHDHSTPSITNASSTPLPLSIDMDFVTNLIVRPNVVAICLVDDHVLRRWGVEPELDHWDGTYVYDPPSLMAFSGHYVIATGIIPIHCVKDSTVIAGLDRLCDPHGTSKAHGKHGEDEHEYEREYEHDCDDDGDDDADCKQTRTTDIDRDSHCIVIKNPGSPNATEFITFDLFEEAWKAKGTDQDIIFIASHSEK